MLFAGVHYCSSEVGPGHGYNLATQLLGSGFGGQMGVPLDLVVSPPMASSGSAVCSCLLGAVFFAVLLATCLRIKVISPFLCLADGMTTVSEWLVGFRHQGTLDPTRC